MARLGDICTKITDGSHNPPQGIPHSEYLMLSSKNIYDDAITLDDPRYLSAENYATENKRTQISTGDILLTIVGTVGRAAVVSDSIKNICLQRSVAVIKPKSGLIDSRFLMYQLQSMRTHLEQEARGVAQKGIYLKQVENLQVKVPSMDEQFLVVKKLDKVSELIALRKEQLSKLDQLVKSRFIELFGDPETNPMGWKCVTVQQAINEKIIDKPLDGNHGGKHPKTSDYVPKGVPFIMANNLVDGRVDMEHCAFITEKQADSLDKGFAKDGDVLITHKGTIGRTAILHCTYPYIMLTPQVTYYRPILGIIPEYLKAYFDTDYFQGVIANIASVGSTRAYIGITAQQELPLLIPALDRQREYAAFVVQTDKSKVSIQQSLDKLELLKKSLMQEYFG